MRYHPSTPYYPEKYSGLFVLLLPLSLPLPPLPSDTDLHPDTTIPVPPSMGLGSRRGPRSLPSFPMSGAVPSEDRRERVSLIPTTGCGRIGPYTLGTDVSELDPFRSFQCTVPVHPPWARFPLPTRRDLPFPHSLPVRDRPWGKLICGLYSRSGFVFCLRTPGWSHPGYWDWNRDSEEVGRVTSDH